MAKFADEIIQALAESWAGMDGHLADYKRERDEGISLFDPTCTGHYEGYYAEAQSILERLERRGFVVVPAPTTHVAPNLAQGGEL
ncbi:hypothetical protein [Methylobacterium sp. Leaf100]|uniref:hypothetical protein n=1 Tax=Methylobacterium sp. Leaf100 TaxID=1736252 RepID=UPI000701EB6F|nr:hypothetical protein [Methylobacterium sp. Leaf100]KQP31410.1 hypothetical protein ASF25_18460 [Methylobacterium sp. Leaf100]